VTQKRSGARHPTEKPLPLGPAWRPMVLYGPLALLGGAPLAYFTFVDPKLLEVQAGPFQLVPIMLWPGLLALAFGQWRELGWHPPRLAALALAALYPLLVAIGAAVLALWTGAGAVAPDASLGDAARDWGRSTLASFAGSLFPVLGEEVGWRGFVQRRLQAWGPHRSVLTAAAVATAYHALATLGPGFKEGGAWAVASFLGAVFLLQVGLGLVYRAGGSLWAPFLFHLLWNTTNPILTGDLYFNQPGLVSGAMWLVNGEGLCGAAASLILLYPLFAAVRAVVARPAPRRSRRAQLGTTVALGAALSGLVVAGALVTDRPVQERELAASPSLATEARASLERALAYLDRHHDELPVDAVFLLRLIEGALPATRAREIAEKGMPAARQDPTYPLFQEILETPRPAHPRRALPAYVVDGPPNPGQPFDEPFSDTCLKGALECRWAPGCREYKTRLGQWGYVLTHQVLFFAFAKEKRCPWDVDPDQFLGVLARAMLREHEAHPEWSDLFAERMGLGLYLGFREFLREEWIRVILRAQEPEGCWRWDSSQPGCSHHSTGMAAWVLALFLGAS
jgi:membrane protease YdiL (CAAX protease family)